MTKIIVNIVDQHHHQHQCNHRWQPPISPRSPSSTNGTFTTHSDIAIITNIINHHHQHHDHTAATTWWQQQCHHHYQQRQQLRHHNPHCHQHHPQQHHCTYYLFIKQLPDQSVSHYTPALLAMPRFKSIGWRLVSSRPKTVIVVSWDHHLISRWESITTITIHIYIYNTLW